MSINMEKIGEYKPPQESREERFSLPEMERSKESVFKLVEKLKERIDAEEYDLLIGDDASGRIPALILRNIINERMRELHPEAKPGERDIETKFIAGGEERQWFSEKYEKVLPILEKMKEGKEKKALLVTEYMGLGKGAVEFTKALEEAKIDFDIASLASSRSSEYYKSEFPELARHDIFIGDEGSEQAFVPFYGSDASGVTKVFGEPIAKRREEGDMRDEELGQWEVKVAREDIKLMSEKTIEKVWGNSKA